MADQAIGRTCPNCGTLTACSGAWTDQFLTGTCVVDGTVISVANPYYVAPPPVMTEAQDEAADVTSAATLPMADQQELVTAVTADEVAENAGP
jgi:hypothetical protein